MKLLFLDIETAPALASVWGLFKENIPLDRLIESGYTLCWAAKWQGERDVYFSSIHEKSVPKMLAGIRDLLNEADAVVTYNGDRFDLPTLNREFIKYGILPPSPYKKIDVLKTVRQQFRFQSNKLAFVAEELGLGSKADTGGYATWVGCMDGDEKSWTKMEKYNKQDVKLLEKLYLKVLPWIKNHPNVGLYNVKSKCSCPNCGSTNLQKRGTSHSKTFRYQRYVCNKCGAWSRERMPFRIPVPPLLIKEN